MKEQNFKIPFESIREAFYVYCDMIERHGKGIKGTPIASFIYWMCDFIFHSM